MVNFGTTQFYPSCVEGAIIDLITNNEESYIEGIDVYNDTCITDIVELMKSRFPHLEWEATQTGNHLHLSWVEDGHLHHSTYRYIWPGMED